MSKQSSREFLEEKLENFRKFCAEIIPKNSRMRRDFDNYTKLPTEAFVAFVALYAQSPPPVHHPLF